MATAVTPGSDASTLNSNISDEEQRWMVIGICLNKVLTPTLRQVLSVEIPKWHQMLVKPPIEIDKQTSGKFAKNLPPSTIKLNYDSINSNAVHKSAKLYDYAVKDPLSLAKLFMKPFMASCTGFDHTMDSSAVLSVMCEAQPFIAVGAAVLAKKIRSDIRNEWAHCDFSHWTEPIFQTALNDIESLVRTLGLTAVVEKIVLDEIDKWRNNGIKLCIGNPVDCELLDLIQSEVGNLQESVTLFNEDSKADKERLLHSLQTFQTSLSMEICDLRHRQAVTEKNVDRLNRLHNQYVSAIQDVKDEVAKITTTNDEIPYVFRAPKKNPWFSGRLPELQDLANVLRFDDSSQPKLNIAAVCGLGGVGKTSLATEFAQQRKDIYTGGVYWFSGEDDTTFENSVYDVATRFGTQSDSFGLTFSATLAMISRNKNPWLIILDNMDQLSLSSNIIKLVSGPWQHDASGHLLITTRRNPTALTNDIRDFDERCCVSLQCFTIEEGKKFIFRRLRIVHDEEMDKVAEKLVQQLGGLPLALEQAGAYIKSLHCTIPQYLELYDLQRLRLLNRQKATSVSVYDSPERVAVHTTWHLNFEHIKQNVDDGKAAIRFLYASAYLNPNEIQKDIINAGEPPIKDEEFSEFMKTTLGREQVLKLLTDFSLFKETLSSNLIVHHLVQEVILENLNPKEELQSISDAICMLHCAFQNCSSPDELLSKGKQERPSIICVDQSRFYNWHKLCLHSYDLVRHLIRMIKQSNVGHAKIFQHETARIVYECAIHLSANSKHDKAKEVANFANDIFNSSNLQVPASSLFPHTIPLPELVRRHIQYSCNTPSTAKKDECRDAEELRSISSEQLKEMRMKGNDLFKKGFYNDALKIYCDAIDISRNTAVFDVTLLSNRASVYLKLEQYDEALEDADDYILKRPKCWRGYARKALALVELKDMQGACVAASLAFYYKRNVFRDFEPFKRKFGSSMEIRLFVCRDTSDLSSALWNVKNSLNVRNISASNSEDFPIIILENGDYLLSSHTIGSSLFKPGNDLIIEKVLLIANCILVGSDGECSVTLDDNHDVFVGLVFSAYNIHFHCRFSNCHFLVDSIVKLTHCSFTSSNDTHASFCSSGKLKVDFCKFYNCIRGGLLVEGDAEITNSQFYGDAVPLEVRKCGRFVLRKSKLYGNKQGLLIGSQAKECVVDDCALYDNGSCGIGVMNCASNVELVRNRICDNDGPGIAMINSKVSIFENEIRGNGSWGIHTIGQAVMKKNEIHNNHCGGILVQTHPFVESPKSVVECNHISFNSGPGIYEEEFLTERRENKLHDNKEERNQLTTQSEAKFCYYCKKEGKNLQKCCNCFTAKYCGEECQKSDWKNHKGMCDRLLADGSIVLNYVRDPIMVLHLPINERDPPWNDIKFAATRTPLRGSGLLPVGPTYCPPPNSTTMFIVKMSANFQPKIEPNRFEVRLYDRSLTIDGILTDAHQIYHLIRHHGAMGQLYNQWKKLFMWAKGPEHGKLRVFIKEFPQYQNW